MEVTNAPAALDALRDVLAGVDVAQVTQLAQRVNLAELLGLVASMDDATLAQLRRAKRRSAPETLPAPDADLYDVLDQASDDDQALRQRLRAFLEAEVEPVITGYWQRDETPVDLLRTGFRDLGLVATMYDAAGERLPGAGLREGLMAYEMARIDTSTATFFGVHEGLAMGSIWRLGSDEQRAAWLPKMQTWDTIGCFGLTEPLVGSATAGGLTTTARREGDTWVLNGQKKWIGNSTFADVAVIFARDVADNQVKAFLVRCKENPGYHVEKIQGKTALRVVENGLITLTDCRVPESDRLQRCHSFKDVADVLSMTRLGVSWGAVGCAAGAYEKALAYTQQRIQFGKPIASFQLVQERLVDMLGNVTGMLTMAWHVTQRLDAGTMTDAQASLSKQVLAQRCRETVALAREVLGGNGILLEHHVARFFCDAEAIYSYEGTNEMNTLIVGRAITGFGAFV